jgi:Regulator of chromosome condensation (RCC1) repeat
MCAGSDNFISTLALWLHEYAGQLGYGALTNVGAEQTPADFTVDLGNGRKAASVVGGYRHTCVLTTDAEVLCFGDGFGGKLVRYCSLTLFLTAHISFLSFVQSCLACRRSCRISIATAYYLYLQTALCEISAVV